MNVPPGEYVVILDQHPNQGPLDFVATIVDGDHAGKGMKISVDNFRCANLNMEGFENED
ncbi:hypothetical protein KAR91_05400 [Candidatus Pacearchaeota archaeon]|nr:hypothetical protein [Candidatus Pacearchaeota archaeon]